MTPRAAIGSLYRRQADFAGRSGRAEFWGGFGFVLVIAICVLGPVLWAMFPQAFGRPDTGGAQGLRLAAMEVAGALAFWVILTVKPLAALLVRRLHDIDRSAHWLAVVLVPGAGLVLVLWWFLQAGSPGENRFGAPAIPLQDR